MTSSHSGSGPSHLVGRDRELGVLREHLAAALAGQGGLVLIGGEAGIGKTALAEALCHEATEKGALVLVGHCYDLTETPPYGPWVELFSRYRPEGDDPPLTDAFTERGTVGAVTSQGALFQQVLNFFSALTSRHPLVLLLDDAHWMDVASLDLLRFLARSLAPHALLLLVTYRSDELTRRHPLYQLLPLLVRESSATRLPLHALAPEETAALVRSRFALADADAARLVAYLDERAEGNPFFVGELLRTLDEEGVLRQRDGAWTLGELNGLQVPPLLRQVIDGRLARLGDEAQALLAIAAVIGQDVPLALWLAVASEDEETLDTVIDRATAARVLEGGGTTTIRFHHALIRDVIYEGISTLRRRRLHRQVAEVLMAAPTPDVDAVASHFQRAGDPQAVAWLLKAGERAFHAFAYRTATQRFETALAMLDAAGTDPHERGWLHLRLWRLRRYAAPHQGGNHLEAVARLAAETEDRGLAAYALRERGMLQCFLGNLGQGVADLQAGMAAADSLTPVDRWQAPSLGGDVRPDDALSTWLAMLGRYADVEPVAGRANTRGVLANRSMGLTHAAMGRPDEARAAFTREREAVRLEGDYYHVSVTMLEELAWVILPYETEQVHERRALARAAEEMWTRSEEVHGGGPSRQVCFPLLVCEGEWGEAKQLADLIVARNRAIRPWQCGLVGEIGALVYAQGDVDLAWHLVRQWLPAGPSTEPGESYYAPALALLRLAALLSLDTGDLSAAQSWLTAHDRWLAWSGTVLGQSAGSIGWARYCRASGDRDGAYTAATQALTSATQPRQPLALLTAHRLLGELATDAGRLEAAATHIGASLDLATTCAAPYERALSLIALGELHATAGNRAGGDPALAEAQSICTTLDAAPARARADALASRLAAETLAHPSFPDSLTAREVDVLRLLASGQTNREMAETLFLSARTVERHIANIYVKTRAHGRADAAAYAIRHGLTPS